MVPFSSQSGTFDAPNIAAVQTDCRAEATAQCKIVLPPGYEIDVRAEVKRQSKPLHRSQCFTAESTIAAELRGNVDDPDSDIESRMKKLMGVIRLIPRSIVAPTWYKGEGYPTVPLHLENRGTETIIIEAGQTMAKLEELQLHEGGSDDII